MVWLQVVTIATKIPGGIDQIIASLYLKYFCNQMIGLGVMVSSSFAVFALNVLYYYIILADCRKFQTTFFTKATNPSLIS